MLERNIARSHCRCALLAGSLWLLPAAGAAMAADVIEFYNSALDNYFITADATEAAAVDSGAAGPGWARTGDTFGAGGNAPVCRFYGSISPGPNSHFYTVLADECAALKALQQTTPASEKRWNFESLDFSSTIPGAGACPSGTTPVYRAYNNGFARGVDSNHRITSNPASLQAVVARGWKNEGTVMCAPALTVRDIEADIVRLLEQSTLGPTEALVQEVKAKGISAWLDQQIALPATRFADRVPLLMGQDSTCIDDFSEPQTPEKRCSTLNGGQEPIAWEFFRQAKSAPDQLRLRMAHIWHQIFVTGRIGAAYGVADFQQRLRDNVFGTFENLLAKYTLSPHLGAFQTWACNQPENNGIKPNENYARELMQLMTIGPNELNEDGTPKLDGTGRLIPAYTQADIGVLARVLTGFAIPPQPGKVRTWCNRTSDYFIGDMIPFEQFHDQGAKTALKGRLSLPAGGGALAEVRALIHVLVEHPNTAPFVSRQLIQKMVTSAPTPAYVARVAAVFRNNGSGVRGDLAAITRAILLDPEARGARKTQARYGRLREPVLFLTTMIRALDVTTDGYHPHFWALNSGQSLYNPETVFNYYPADFTLAGGNVPAPEFGIFTSGEFRMRSNHVNDILYTGMQPMPWIPNATGTVVPTLAAFLADAADVNRLVDRLDLLFLHGTMRSDMRRTIVNAVGKIAPSDGLQRTRLAIHLILASVDYQVQK